MPAFKPSSILAESFSRGLKTRRLEALSIGVMHAARDESLAILTIFTREVGNLQFTCPAAVARAAGELLLSSLAKPEKIARSKRYKMHGTPEGILARVAKFRAVEEELKQPGAKLYQVCAKHGINAGSLRYWRKNQAEARLPVTKPNGSLL